MGDTGDTCAVILLVEDDGIVRFTTSEILREEGYTVVEAVNADEALRLLHGLPIVDLVLSDVRMPGEMDGVQLASAIKASRPGLPIAIVSTHLPEHVSHVADAFVAKPFRAAALLRSVEDLLGHEWQNRRRKQTAS